MKAPGPEAEVQDPVMRREPFGDGREHLSNSPFRSSLLCPYPTKSRSMWGFWAKRKRGPWPPLNVLAEGFDPPESGDA